MPNSYLQLNLNTNLFPILHFYTLQQFLQILLKHFSPDFFFIAVNFSSVAPVAINFFFDRANRGYFSSVALILINFLATSTNFTTMPRQTFRPRHQFFTAPINFSTAATNFLTAATNFSTIPRLYFRQPRLYFRLPRLISRPPRLIFRPCRV